VLDVSGEVQASPADLGEQVAVQRQGGFPGGFFDDMELSGCRHIEIPRREIPKGKITSEPDKTGLSIAFIARDVPYSRILHGKAVTGSLEGSVHKVVHVVRFEQELTPGKLKRSCVARTLSCSGDRQITLQHPREFIEVRQEGIQDCDPASPQTGGSAGTPVCCPVAIYYPARGDGSFDGQLGTISHASVCHIRRDMHIQNAIGKAHITVQTPEGNLAQGDAVSRETGFHARLLQRSGYNDVGIQRASKGAFVSKLI